MTDSHNFSELACLAKDKHQRLFIHIQGAEQEALDEAATVAIQIIGQLDTALSHYCLSESASFSSSKLSSIHNVECLQALQAQNKMRQLLGQDCGVLVINAYSGFNPNTLGLSSGCITAGAALIIVSPASQDWPHFDDPDYKRLRSGATHEQAIPGYYLQRTAQRLEQQSLIIQGVMRAGAIEWKNKQAVCDHLTLQAGRDDYLAEAIKDQNGIIEDICHVSTGHAKRPVILAADRGRGKSSAMGMAAARLLFQTKQPIHIAVTAPQPSAVATLFHHAHKELIALLEHEEGIELEEGKLCYQGSCIQFYAVDKLQQPTQCKDNISLLLVDEAAAIPSMLLAGLLKHYTRLVFSTTVYGYEGNGRGFSLRFMPVLKVRMPQYKQRFLQQPLRWSKEDVVETVVNDLLLLDAERCSETETNDADVIDLEKATFEQFTQCQLLQTPKLLQSVFSLLVSAHYQTSGDDLRVLLDHPDVKVMTLTVENTIVAVILLMLEGGFTAADKQLLLNQHRRFRGHLLPQQCLNAGFDQALDFTYARVMRIAVTPALQRAGLGAQLLKIVEQEIEHTQIADFYGASFAAEPYVLRFWQKNGFDLIALGSRKDSSSGLFTVSVMKCLSHNVTALDFHAQLQTQWRHNLSYQLLTQVNDIHVELLSLLYKNVCGEYALHDYAQLQNYCQQRRGFEVVKPAMYRFIQYILSTNATQQWLAEVDEDKIHLLLEALLLNRSLQDLAQMYNYNGRKAIEVAFRTTLQPLLLAVKTH